MNRARILQRNVVSLAAIMILCPLVTTYGSVLLLHSSLDNSDISGTTVADTAGAPQNGTLSSSSVTANVTGQIGQAIDVNLASTDTAAVDYGNVLDAGNGIQTISIWFNAASAQTAYLAQKGNNNSLGIGWSIFIQSGAHLYVYFRANANGGSDNADRAAAYGWLPDANPTNTWHNAVMIVDAQHGSLTGYLDGTQVPYASSWGTTFTADADGVTTSDPLQLGYLFDGKLDDFAIFDGALTQSQITQIYQRGLNGQDVPEPATISLLAAAGMLLGLSRGRHA